MNRKRVIALLIGVFFLLQVAIVAYWHSLAAETSKATDALISLAIVIVVGIVDFGVARHLLASLARLEAAYGYEVAERLEQSLASYRAESLREERIAQDLGASVASELSKAREALAQGNNAAASDHMRASLDIAKNVVAPACENVTVAAVLASKSRQCAQEGVALDPHVTLPEPLPLPDIDVAAIFFNLIDNALHECQALVAEGIATDPHITVSARIQAGQLFVKVENPSHHGVDTKKRVFERRSATSMQHGWGTDIVSTIAKEHGGIAEFDEQDGLFVASVMIPLPQQDRQDLA